ncbi:MAG: Rid family detoxifying hydrolase [Acidobacteriota bacterium]|nr:Rid family detoxifying hydrolase [Acidobacteriota bacterium]
MLAPLHPAQEPAPGARRPPCVPPASRTAHGPRFGWGPLATVRAVSGRETYTAAGAPAPVGPYSHAVRSGDLLFCSGQVALDARTGTLVDGPAGEQARVCLENLGAVCAAAGASLQDAVRLTIYLTDMASFAEVNEVYGSFFAGEPPARVTVAVAGLPAGAGVEIDAIVALGAR